VRDVSERRTQVVTTHFGDIANGISPQGRFVLFTSKAGKLVPGDTNRVRDVFVRDLRTGATHRISVSSAERQGNRPSIGVAISSGGRYCLFESAATDLVAGDTNGVTDLFLRDRVHGRTIRVDISTAGLQADRPVRFAALSADGRWAAFTSPATNLVTGDTNAVRDVFARGPLH
jgi:Tol biopolymer transport system component